jgi:tryptophan 2,3-dioxygenase
MNNSENYRALEDSIKTDFSKDMSYGDYLNLEPVLTAQKPLSNEHDEMLFIIIHQASELWLKLVGVELISAIDYVKDGDFRQSFKVISRVKQIFNQLTQSWDVLKTLTPVDYLKFRGELGSSSGFQSYGYRKIEFLLGNKNKDLVRVHQSNERIYEELNQTLHQPSLYDEIIRVLDKKGFKIDAAVLDRDFSEPYKSNESVKAAFLDIYRNAEQHYDFYELAEKLVDVEDAFQQWRFKHMYTVQRIIGHRMGTGGSSGVSFLKKALDTSFFPGLFELRKEL